MFVLLSKTLDVLAAPLTWAALLLVLGLALRRRRPRLAAVAPWLAVAVLVTFSLDGVTRRLEAALEADAVSTFRPDPPYDAVIVLGGMVDDGAARRSGEVELTAAADRIVRAALLLRAGEAREVLVTGGGQVFPVAGDVPEAEQLARLLVALGVAPERIVTAGGTRNTREDAVESARIVAARGWRRVVLLTSAYHAPRALGCFRAVGLEPDVLPVDRRAGDGAGRPWLPRAGALARSTDVLREALGRVVYRLRDWTAPAPPAR